MGRAITIKCLTRLSILAVLLFAHAGTTQELTFKQQILMPGPLIEGHAEFEARCESCHSPFSKQSISERCLDCHDTIAADRNRQRGFHGRDPAASSGNCDTCHTDHEGREADITSLMADSFNHAHTNFALLGVHSQLRCDSCHNQGQPWRETPVACIGCHREDDRHNGALGEQCGQCHQPDRWTQLRPFDHGSTDFALHGKHTSVPCISCHIGQQFSFENQRCIACHRANDVHSGGNGDDCASCHNATSWEQVDFNHDNTDFPLHGGHRDLPCQACHRNDQPRDNTPTQCNSCHRGDDIHLGRNGSECQQCHGESRWADVRFEHNRDTDFPLSGTHNQLSCNQCHTGVLKDSLPRDCAGCHRADDVHKDAAMVLCGTCHGTDNWRTINRFDHDLSPFPLIGMHRIVPCHSCHVGNQFSLTDTDCNACHQQDDRHKGGLGTNCGQCHNSNAWTLWQFDHSKQTGFELTGKHQGLECAACHTPGGDPAQTPRLCGGCHRQQDIHNGEFGERCERCHSTSNFFELNLE